MLSEGAAHAQTAATWKTNVSGNWGTATNWDIGQVPNNNGSNLFNATINNGSSNLDHNYTIQNFFLNGGTLTGANTLTANNIFNWSGGNIGPSSTVNANGGLNLSNTGNILLDTGAILNNTGTANLTGTGNVYADDKGTFNNQAGATFTAQSGSHDLAVGSGTPVFNNAGTFVNNSGAGNTTTIGYQFNNTGTVNAQSGDLTLTNGGTLGGTFTGAGNVNLSSGTFNFQKTNLTGTGAVNIGTLVSGTLSGTGSVNLAGGSNNFLLLDTGAILNNAVTANLTNTNNVFFNDQGTFNNQAGATFTAQSGSHSLAVGSGTPIFNNAGTFVNNSGTGNTTTIGVQFNNTGTVNAQSGDLTLTGGGTLGGTFTGAGNVNLSSGTFNFQNANFTGTGAVNIGTLVSGTLSGTGSVNLAGGSNNFLLLNTGAILNNAVTANLTNTNNVFFNDKGTFNNQAGATFTAQSGSHSLAVGSGTPVFNNAGTFVNNSGAGTTTIGLQFNNTGTVNAQSGDLTLTGGGTLGGTFTGAGNVNLNSGTFNFQNANFTGTGAVNIGTLVSGTLSGTGSVNLAGGSNNFLLLNTGAILSNAGIINLTNTNNVFFNDQGTFNNQAGATFTAQSGSHSLAVGSGTPIFNNAGTFVNNSGATNTTTVGLQFNNTGNVQATSGNLQFTGAYTQTAGSTVLNGGTLQSSNPLAINGGSLSGTGTITSNVNIGNGKGAGATIKAGSSPGQLNIIGNLTLASNATSEFDIAGITQGTQYSFLNVTGSANLNGGLLVNLLNGFNPSSSNIFTILTASNGISGTFNTNQISNAQATFNVVYTANSVELENVQSTPVPEPSSTLGILSLGILGGGSFLKRKLKGRKQAS